MKKSLTRQVLRTTILLWMLISQLAAPLTALAATAEEPECTMSCSLLGQMCCCKRAAESGDHEHRSRDHEDHSTASIESVPSVEAGWPACPGTSGFELTRQTSVVPANRRVTPVPTPSISREFAFAFSNAGLRDLPPATLPRPPPGASSF